MPPGSFDDFDDYAEDYRAIHTRNVKISGADSFYFARMKVKLLEGFEKDTPSNMLDVGCGDGTTESFMAKHFPQWRLTGIDVSARSIEAANALHIPAATFLSFDGSNIPFPDETFDLVFMAGVLHHVSFDLHQQLLKEVNRVLKKGSRFYLFEHNPMNPLTRHLVNTCEFDKHARLLKSSYTETLLKNTGFSLLQKQFIIFFPRMKIFTPFIWLERFLNGCPLVANILL